RPRVRNGHFEAREWKDEVVFLRRLVTGGASRSYGIAVAQLAGLPAPVVERARQILDNLEGDELDPEGLPRLAKGSATTTVADAPDQLSFALGASTPRPAEEEEVLVALREVDPNATTPLDALLLLGKLRDRLGGGSGS
ncbi:MAG: DNA mismatch repair protein MutS, partial [bacterium]|nr:DNA mismatch repair protein MutS [bacterium]